MRMPPAGRAILLDRRSPPSRRADRGTARDPLSASLGRRVAPSSDDRSADNGRAGASPRAPPRRTRRRRHRRHGSERLSAQGAPGEPDRARAEPVPAPLLHDPPVRGPSALDHSALAPSAAAHPVGAGAGRAPPPDPRASEPPPASARRASARRRVARAVAGDPARSPGRVRRPGPESPSSARDARDARDCRRGEPRSCLPSPDPPSSRSSIRRSIRPPMSTSISHSRRSPGRRPSGSPQGSVRRTRSDGPHAARAHASIASIARSGGCAPDVPEDGDRV